MKYVHFLYIVIFILCGWLGDDIDVRDVDKILGVSLFVYIESRGRGLRET